MKKEKIKESIEYLVALKREIAVTGSLNHENIIKLYEVIGDFESET